jgi:FtsZ-binding cell division protein ZapB/RNA polymerase subunit RPABC4/transcription elongation factor Spt4
MTARQSNDIFGWVEKLESIVQDSVGLLASLTKEVDALKADQASIKAECLHLRAENINLRAEMRSLYIGINTDIDRLRNRVDAVQEYTLGTAADMMRRLHDDDEKVHAAAVKLVAGAANQMRQYPSSGDTTSDDCPDVMCDGCQSCPDACEEKPTMTDFEGMEIIVEPEEEHFNNKEQAIA